jgi:uncharacterized protein
MTQPNGRRLAVVTGGSTGIGLELVRQFATHGYDVVVAADDAEVNGVGAKLDSAVDVIPVQCDLATPNGVAALHRRIVMLGRPIDVLALNAGVAAGGAFVDTPLEDDLEVVRLDVESIVHLAKLLIPDMVGRSSGKVLVTASVAARMPGPYYATYAASKAFALSFAEALRYELRDTGVTVTALMPGPTDTEFFRRSEMEDTRVAAMDKDDPADVARDGFEGLMEGKDIVVAGSAANLLQAWGARVTPERVKAAAHARLTEPGSGD